MLEQNVEHTKALVQLSRYAGRHKTEVAEHRASRDSFEIVGYEVDPGDVVAFDYHILHHAGAGVNMTEKRRALAVIYGDEHATLKHRPNPIPGPLEQAGATYIDGQSIAEFPQVFPAC